MAPGQKAPGQKAGKPTAAATEVNPYLLQRDQNILRNSQALACLGVGRAKELLNSSVAKRPKRKTPVPEHFGSFIEPEDDGFDLDAPDTITTASPATMKGGSSKRVRAPNEQELQQPVRRTRQKTRELSLTEAEATSNQEDYAESEFNAAMEAIMADDEADGNATKTPAEVVVEVLPKTTFLRNVGIQLKGKKTKASDAAAAARVEELESELESSKQLAQDMKEQMERMGKQMEESEAARLKQAADMESLKNGKLEESISGHYESDQGVDAAEPGSALTFENF
ncbi:hypothetical protein EJB05_33380, partial [Eragrostis curvula]